MHELWLVSGGGGATANEEGWGLQLRPRPGRSATDCHWKGPWGANCRTARGRGQRGSAGAGRGRQFTQGGGGDIDFPFIGSHGYEPNRRWSGRAIHRPVERRDSSVTADIMHNRRGWREPGLSLGYSCPDRHPNLHRVRPLRNWVSEIILGRDRQAGLRSVSAAAISARPVSTSVHGQSRRAVFR